MLLAAAVMLAEPSGDVPLSPSGSWVVDYQDNSCVLSRSFGTGKNKVQIGWRATPLSGMLELLVNTHSLGKIFMRGSTVVRLSTGVSADAPFTSYPTTENGRRILRAKVPAVMFRELPASLTMAVEPQHFSPTIVALPGVDKAFAALEHCDRDTLKSWGVDAAAQPEIAEPSRSITDETKWFTADDYPPEAIQAQMRGNTTLLWKIGVDGRVHDCRAVIPSGAPVLDARACTVLTERGRYMPAKDASGKPVETLKTRSIEWQVPGGWQKAKAK